MEPFILYQDLSLRLNVVWKYQKGILGYFIILQRVVRRLTAYIYLPPYLKVLKTHISLAIRYKINHRLRYPGPSARPSAEYHQMHLSYQRQLRHHTHHRRNPAPPHPPPRSCLQLPIS